MYRNEESILGSSFKFSVIPWALNIIPSACSCNDNFLRKCLKHSKPAILAVGLQSKLLGSKQFDRASISEEHSLHSELYRFPLKDDFWLEEFKKNNFRKGHSLNHRGCATNRWNLKRYLVLCTFLPVELFSQPSLLLHPWRFQQQTLNRKFHFREILLAAIPPWICNFRKYLYLQR